MKHSLPGNSISPLRAPITAQQFQTLSGVDDQVMAHLEQYFALLERWQKKINLVGNASLGDAWRRHFLDSAQLHSLVPGVAKTLLDLGSGAGFPGMVLAIMGGHEVHLVEGNARKAAFLAEIKRATKTQVTIHNCRIEALPTFAVDVVAARALAPLDRLLDYAYPFLGTAGICLFAKGRTADRELTDSQKKWKMRVASIQSLSDPSGTILKLEEVSHHGY